MAVQRWTVPRRDGSVLAWELRWWKDRFDVSDAKQAKDAASWIADGLPAWRTRFGKMDHRALGRLVPGSLAAEALKGGGGQGVQLSSHCRQCSPKPVRKKHW